MALERVLKAQAARKPQKWLPPGGDEAAAWQEVFRMLQQGGQSERGAHYALAVASLKRKSEEVQEEINTLNHAEASLLQTAKEEYKEKMEALGDARPEERDPKQAKIWGQSLRDLLVKQVRGAAEELEAEQAPNLATEMALEAQKQVTEALEGKHQAEAEIEQQAMLQAGQTLRLQQEAVAQAQALAEAQANALRDAQAQAEALSTMQFHAQAAAPENQQQLQALTQALAQAATTGSLGGAGAEDVAQLAALLGKSPDLDAAMAALHAAAVPTS